MSKTAKDFIQAARQNEDLRLEIEKLGQDVPALVNFAKSKGYEFSEAEFVATVRAEGHEIETALSDEELSAVAGGTDYTMWNCDSFAETYCGENSCDCPSTDWPQC